MNKIIFPVILLLIWSGRSQAQDSFQNLDFESAQNNGNPYAATNALPRWSAFAVVNAFGITRTQQLSSIQFGFSLSTVSVALIPVANSSGRPATIDGNFSVLLGNGIISQTGQMPADAQSLLFKAATAQSLSSLLMVSLGGQDLSYTAISNVINANGPNYTLYGANIPAAFAGQTETLSIIGLNAGSSLNTLLDDIQFSPTAVPEPSWISLTCIVGGLLFYVRARKRTGS